MKLMEGDQYCFCLTKRIVAFIIALITLLKVSAQISFQAYVYQGISPKVPADHANFSVFLVGQVLQLLVTILLFVAIYKENADFMWPYLCWLSLNLLLEGFGCLILVYTNPNLTVIMRDFIVYCISLSMSVGLIYFTNNYEKELRKREEKLKDDLERGDEISELEEEEVKSSEVKT